MRKQDIVVLLFYLMGFSFIRNQYLKLRNKPVARFIGFHDIMPNNQAVFEKNLNVLKNKTNVISLNDFFIGRLVSDKINTVITFDDGYDSWITTALPILKKLCLPATFFVSSGFIGLSKDAEAHFLKTNLFKKLPNRKISGSLNNDDLKKIVDSGFTIGGHTVNHVDLGLIKDEQKLNYEIMKDKFALEKIIGTEINFFSYPTGVYNNTNINLSNLLRAAGYKGAVTVVSGFNTEKTDPYRLHRDIIWQGLDSHIFLARIFGNYDAVAFFKKNWCIRLKRIL